MPLSAREHARTHPGHVVQEHLTAPWTCRDCPERSPIYRVSWPITPRKVWGIPPAHVECPSSILFPGTHSPACAGEHG